MQVSQAMTKNVVLTRPDAPISEAARLMGELDAGVLPVGEGDRLVGMVTDRDIAVRAIGAGKGVDTPVSEVMTPDVKYCFEDEELEEVAANMGDNRIRRLPVLSREKRLVGIISLGDVALAGDPAITDDALTGISESGPPGSQTAA